MIRLTTRAAALAAALLIFLIPQLAHATHMPGVGEVLILLLGISAIVGIPTAGITVLIVGLVQKKRKTPKTAGYLVKLGLIVFGAFPVTILLFTLIVTLLFG